MPSWLAAASKIESKPRLHEMIGRRASDADAEQTNWRWGARPIAAYWVRALIAAACQVYAINPLQGQA